ncbi:MAG: acetyltransferase [Betaproteobacteria bacterium]
MRFYDIFNGDADGLCALHQLRLAEPRSATLITGVKRDIALLARVPAEAGDELTVLDVSLDTNRNALLSALQAGARVRYFDHHFAGAIPHHRLLTAHIDPSPAVCTSLIVDRHLGGRYRAWSVVAAFGDNLRTQAYAGAAALGLGAAEIEMLRELGESLNYNAYGDSLADLHFHPAELYRRMQPYADPLVFCAQAAEFDILRRASAGDLRQAQALPVEYRGDKVVVVCMPDAAWSRRIVGTFANELVQRHAERTVAVLVRNGAGYQVSLRAPENGKATMHLLAQQFATGNGRARAAGIQFLPESERSRLMALLDQTTADGMPSEAP